MKIVLAIVLAVALVVFGIWIDILYFYVGGIEEIVRGAQASPVSGHDIGWGIVRLIFGGVGTAVGIGLAVLTLGLVNWDR